MARRLALLAMLLAVSAAVNTAPRPPSRSEEYSDSQSIESYPFWDYEESRETTPRPRNNSAKVPKNKNPKFNVTMKNTKSDNKKKFIKTTNINIETHAQFVVTKKPVAFAKPVSWAGHPVVKVNGEYVLLDVPMPVVSAGGSSPRPSTTRPAAPRKPQRTARPAQRPTARPTPRPKPRSTTRRKSSSTTKRSTTARPKKRPIKPTKATIIKTTCRPNKPGWLSSFFQNNKTKKEVKKPPKSWFSGFFSKVYNWIYKSIWRGDGWFSDPKPPAPPSTTTTTTTTEAPFASTNNWFESFLESEENDVTFASNPDTGTKKSMKKSVKRNYKGYQLLRAYPDVQWKVHEMLELQEEGEGSGLMWWTAPSMNGSTDLLVPPDLLPDVKDHLKSSKVDYDVVIWDLQKAIMYENPRLSKKQRLELEHLRGHPMTWRRYHRYADILRYLEYLQHSHADLVELIPLGRSSEGLPLVAVKISMPSNDTNTKDSINKAPNKKYKLRSKMKPAVWIDGGMHAREWIAPAVATWIIQTLVEGEKGLGPENESLKQADFFILPLLNPDGYEHSHTHDRLWKKTRSRPSEHSEDYFNGWFPWNWGQTECVGVDVDRNWDYHWSEKDSSREPCSDNYAGPHPFSEPETRAVSEFLLENRGQIKVYISLHAYSQAWLLPSTHAHAPFSDDGVLMEMGKLATAALADMYGTKYQVGTAAEIRQPASGMSHDWAKARAGIKFSYHVDLRDSYGPYGFLLPGSQIVSTARETWQAIKTIVDNLGPG